MQWYVNCQDYIYFSMLFFTYSAAKTKLAYSSFSDKPLQSKFLKCRKATFTAKVLMSKISLIFMAISLTGFF